MPFVPAPTQLQLIREIAMVQLRQYSGGNNPIRECYLFEKDFFSGVRYESGLFCFEWMADEDFATVKRGEAVVENCRIEGTDERKVA